MSLGPVILVTLPRVSLGPWKEGCHRGGNHADDDLPPSYLQTAFIKQEALEKAREIKVKADEEFAIEKVRAA